VRAVLLSAIAIGCSLNLGTPATLGWPSSDPADYAYWQGHNCHVYEKTVAIDMAIAIAGIAITAASILRDSENLTIGAGAVTTPFVVSAIAGQLGRSRCNRWAEFVPLHVPPGTDAGSGLPPGPGSGAPGEPDGPPPGTSRP
jgi:hypothetical protein